METEVQYHDAAGMPVDAPDAAGIIEIVEVDDESGVALHSISLPEGAPE